MQCRLGKITFIARMTVQDGREPEFVRLMEELASYVRASEPGTVGYEFYRLREPRRYAVLESFADEAAATRHSTSETLARLGPLIGACLVGTWELEHFDPL